MGAQIGLRVASSHGGLSLADLNSFGTNDDVVWALSRASRRHPRYSKLRLLDLLEIKLRIQTWGGKGGGEEVLIKYLQDIALGVVSATVFELIRFGTSRALRALRSVAMRRTIQKQIKRGLREIDLSQISPRDIGKYVSTLDDLTEAEKRRLVTRLATKYAAGVRKTLNRSVQERTKRS